MKQGAYRELYIPFLLAYCHAANLTSNSLKVSAAKVHGGGKYYCPANLPLPLLPVLRWP